MNAFGITPDPGVAASLSGWICEKCGVYVPDSIGYHVCPNSIYDGSNQPQIETAYDANHAAIMKRLDVIELEMARIAKRLDEIVRVLRG